MRIAFVVAAGSALAFASPAETQLAPGFGFQQGRASRAQVLQLRADAASLLEAERKFNWFWKDAQGKALNAERWKEITGGTKEGERPDVTVEELARSARQWGPADRHRQRRNPGRLGAAGDLPVPPLHRLQADLSHGASGP